MIILLYVMDSLRPDFLSCYGYGKETSPHIDQVACQSAVFLNAFAQTTWTRPAAACFLSALYPSAHGVIRNDHVLQDSVPRLPEYFKGIGFKTAALTTNVTVSPVFGFGKGFDHFIEIYRKAHIVEKRKRAKLWKDEVVTTSEDINEYLFPILEENRDRNLFLFVWSSDTHHPFFHRDPQLKKFCPSDEMLTIKEFQKMRTEDEIHRVKLFYEDMIYYNDQHIGNLVRKLKTLGLFDETLLIVTSDHGESFGEHEPKSHGGPPYEEQIRVPLIIKFPGSEFCKKYDCLVQQIDIAPTLLEYMHVSNSRSFGQGVTLLPLLKEGRKVNDFIHTDSQLAPKIPRYLSLRTTDYKYIESRPWKLTSALTSEKIRSWYSWHVRKPKYLYDLRTDEGEKVNLADTQKEMTRDFELKVKAILRGNKQIWGGFEKKKTDKKKLRSEDVAKQLRALGYFD